MWIVRTKPFFLISRPYLLVVFSCCSKMGFPASRNFSLSERGFIKKLKSFFRNELWGYCYRRLPNWAKLCHYSSRPDRGASWCNFVPFIDTGLVPGVQVEVRSLKNSKFDLAIHGKNSYTVNTTAAVVNTHIQTFSCRKYTTAVPYIELYLDPTAIGSNTVLIMNKYSIYRSIKFQFNYTC